MFAICLNLHENIYAVNMKMQLSNSIFIDILNTNANTHNQIVSVQKVVSFSFSDRIDCFSITIYHFFRSLQNSDILCFGYISDKLYDNKTKKNTEKVSIVVESLERWIEPVSIRFRTFVTLLSLWLKSIHDNWRASKTKEKPLAQLFFSRHIDIAKLFRNHISFSSDTQ